MKKFLLAASLLLFACTGGGDTEGEQAPTPTPTPTPTPKPTPKPTPTVVIPTNVPASVGEDVTLLRLQPGKLIGLEQITESVCKRALAADMWIDAIARDKNMWAEGVGNELREFAFYEAGRLLKEYGTKIWGMHLPYSTYDIASLDENHRTTAVSLLSHLIDIAVEHIKPYQLTIHPSTGSYLTTDADFNKHLAASRKSIVELQKALDQANKTYNGNTILCVENCSKSVAYDAQSLLTLLDYPGLEKVRVCLDTGHALIPQNGSYITTKAVGDVVQMLKTLGTRLGTLHIQQNIGLKEYPYDKHLQPWTGGLIDWGQFYKVLMEDCGYRGCFLYETNWVGTYEGDTKANIENVRKNYDTVIVPAFETLISKD